MNPVVTIAIPCYNNRTTVLESLHSALKQKYPHKEILVCDDGSTDGSREVIEHFPSIRLIKNETNLGIGYNLVKLMDEAKGKYVVYLCADDLFASDEVVGDIVQQFNRGDPAVGVIGRYYYFFMNGHEGAIGVCRERNILIQSCCPSGMAFRRMPVAATNKIFIEMPFIVAQYLKMWRWTMLEYDTVAARFHPGGNTGTKKTYYVESPTQNWIYLLGENFKDFPMFIQLKNRAPHMLWNEIKLHVRNDKTVLIDPSFWFHAIIAVLVPSFILRKLTLFYRHRIARRSAKIIKRGS